MKKTIIFILSLYFLSIQPSFAYLDPGSGSAIMSMIIGFFVAIGVILKTLLKEALLTRTPILGVCRGLQLINVYYNGKLVRIKGHAGTNHRLITQHSYNPFEFPSNVNSFHDFAVPRKFLGKNLIPLAHDTEDNIEAFYHPKDKVLGIMWHPERMLPPLKSDFELIKGHFKV